MSKPHLTWTCCEHCAPHINAEIEGRDKALKEAQGILESIQFMNIAPLRQEVQEWLEKYSRPEGNADE